MESLLLSPSSEPQNPNSDPANTKVNHQADEEVKYEKMMMKKKTKQSNLEKRKLKAKKKEIINNDEASSSSCSSSYNSTRRVSRVTHRLRNPSVRLGMTRRSIGERQAEALALPLGMSFAAFANLVLERKNAEGQNVYIDDLAVISASAVTESLANVYGDKLGSFATNFEKSFNSTLRILKLINKSAFPHQLDNNNVGRCDLDRSTEDGCSDTELSAKDTSSVTSAYEVIQGSATANSSMNEIVLHEASRQLSSVHRSSTMPLVIMDRFLEEQTRANDLKTEEISLTKIELSLKQTELAQRHVSNILGKSQLEMDASKAAFRTEKYQTELGDTRKAEMVTKVMDWLVMSVFTMLACMLSGVYVFSRQRISEATSFCEPAEEKTSSWSWIPNKVSSIGTEFNIMICRIRVWVQIFSGVLMVFFFTYLISQRSSGVKPTMPGAFIVIFLGIVCGLSGKLCVDTLGGDGKLWLILWEVFCLLQFLANVFTLALYELLYGPINVTQGTEPNRCRSSKVPYWTRRCFFFGVFLFILPAINGFLPFATFGEWRDHISTEFFGGSGSNV